MTRAGKQKGQAVPSPIRILINAKVELVALQRVPPRSAVNDVPDAAHVQKRPLNGGEWSQRDHFYHQGSIHEETLMRPPWVFDIENCAMNKFENNFFLSCTSPMETSPLAQTSTSNLLTLFEMLGNQDDAGNALQIYNTNTSAGEPLQFKNDLVTDAQLAALPL